MVQSGKMSSSEANSRTETLAHDLRNYPQPLIEGAIQKHREESVFFPELADLMKFMKPRLEHSRRVAEMERKNVPWSPDAQKEPKRKGFEQIAIAAGLQDEPQEVRTAAVSGWKDGGAERLMDAGIEAERLRIGTKITEKPVIDSKDQPWHEANELKASALRINAHDEALGRPACFRLSTPTKPNTKEMEK